MKSLSMDADKCIMFAAQENFTVFPYDSGRNCGLDLNRIGLLVPAAMVSQAVENPPEFSLSYTP
jgi:hypothetical protein